MSENIENIENTPATEIDLEKLQREREEIDRISRELLERLKATDAAIDLERKRREHQAEADFLSVLKDHIEEHTVSYPPGKARVLIVSLDADGNVTEIKPNRIGGMIDKRGDTPQMAAARAAARQEYNGGRAPGRKKWEPGVTPCPTCYADSDPDRPTPHPRKDCYAQRVMAGESKAHIAKVHGVNSSTVAASLKVSGL